MTSSCIATAGLVRHGSLHRDQPVLQRRAGEVEGLADDGDAKAF